MGVVALLGTLDTKADEIGDAARCLRDAGVEPLIVDISTRGEGGAEVARAAGREPSELGALPREECQRIMVAGATAMLGELYGGGRLDGAFALGGSNNTAMAAAVFRTLPIGVPKLILSTMTAGDVAEYVGGSDLVLAASVVDIAGLNRLSRTVIANAAGAVAGMVAARARSDRDGATGGAHGERPVIACSMIGLTTTAVAAARELLEGEGCEVITFHMTGRGGLAMESFIASGAVDGVLDLTTSELADDLYGGVCSAGPDRLRAAARRGLPQVVAPGGLDMINFGPRATVPERFGERRIQVHNAQVTLVRTTPGECAELGRELVRRLTDTGHDGAPAPVIALPQDGLSAIDRPGGPFHDPDATGALSEAVTESADPGRLTVTSIKGDVDQPEFGREAARRLLALLATPT